MGTSDIDRAGSPLFTYVNENIFKKETFLGECIRGLGVEKKPQASPERLFSTHISRDSDSVPPSSVVTFLQIQHECAAVYFILSCLTEAFPLICL